MFFLPPVTFGNVAASASAFPSPQDQVLDLGLLRLDQSITEFFLGHRLQRRQILQLLAG